MKKPRVILLLIVGFYILYTPSFSFAGWKTDCSFSSFESNEKNCFLTREYADSYFSFNLSRLEEGITLSYRNESDKDILTDSEKFLARVDDNAPIDLVKNGKINVGLDSISSTMTPETAQKFISQLLEGNTLRLRIGLIEPEYIEYIDFELSLSDFNQAWLEFQQETPISWNQ